jgi:hypothetical protein
MLVVRLIWSVLQNLSYQGAQLIVTLQFCNMTIDCPLDFLARMLGLNASLFVCNMQFYFTHSSLLLYKSWLVQIILFALALWLTYLLIAWLTHVRFPSFFNYHVYDGYGDHNISFAFKSLHLFYFFFYWHLRKGGAQLVFQRVMMEIVLLLHNTFTELLIVNLVTSFHILTQRLFILPRRQSPPEHSCVRLFGKFHFVKATSSLPVGRDRV